MLQNRIYASALVALVSIPGFLIGQKVREGEPGIALMLLPLTLLVVMVASALMRQSD